MTEPRVEVLLLGPLEARAGGTPVALGGPRPRALLALLALEANRPVALDRLVEALWSEGERPASARHAVRVYASRLRGELGGAIASRAGGYVLEADPQAVDAQRFERLLSAARQLRASGDARAARERLDAALGLWRGPALVDFAYADWAQPEIERLEELRAAALEERFEAELELGRHAAVLPALERHVAAHPLRERARGQLMLALYRSGRQADALAAYREARETLVGELGIEPGADLRELQAAILRQDEALTVEDEELRARRRLPTPATPLVGRRSEVADVMELLTGPARLVTLTGPGGTGKTRVALAAAWQLARTFPDGIWFVDLAPVRDDALVADAVARALGLAEDAGRPRVDTLRDHLRDRRALLVLDNFEHVEEAAPLVGELLAAAPGVRVLATSRVPLRLYGEHRYAVPPLALEDEAVPLFVERARAAGAQVARASVGDLCLRLDCLPLALELAAARAGELSVSEMLAALPPLDLATSGPRDVPERQRTLRAAIGWSVDRLEPPLGDVFAALSVFVGGWTAEAALAVAGTEEAALEELHGRSLVRLDSGRFSMLETIREYAHERLGAPEVVRRRHAEHFVGLAEGAERAVAGGDEQVAWLDRLETEHGNLRAALGFSIERGDAETALRLVAALGRFWEWRGHVREGARWCEAALALPGAPPELRVRGLLRASAFAHLLGDLASATRLGEEALALGRERGDVRSLANALRKLATIAKDAGALDRAEALHEEALALSRSAEDVLGVSSSLINLADLALVSGDHTRAIALAHESAELARRLGDAMRETVSLLNLGLATLAAGDDRTAAAAFARASELAHALRSPDSLAVALEGLAALAVRRGDHEPAVRLVGAAQRMSDESGYALEAAEQALHARTVAEARSALGDEALAAALRAGGSLSFEQAAHAARAAVRA